MSVSTFTHSRSRSGFALGDLIETWADRKTSQSELHVSHMACSLHRIRPPISLKVFLERRLNIQGIKTSLNV